MARIRTIKPEFFRHEQLQDLEQANPGSYVMLVFAGLWCQCDKNGSFLWRPRTLKLDILPFLDFDLGASLVLLREAGVIDQYESGGDLYGFIPSFKDHQRISGKEAQDKAKYPEPNDNFTTASQGSIGEATEKHPVAQEGKGKERKGKDRGADAPKYAFDGKTVKLTEIDLERWRRNYPRVSDLTAELTAADDYYTENPTENGKWFFPVSAWLKRANDGKSGRPRGIMPMPAGGG